MSGIGHDLGLARAAHHGSATERKLHGRGRDRRPWPQRVAGDAVRAVLLRESEHAQRHPILGERIGQVPREPLGSQIERRRERQDVRIPRPLQVRQAGARGDESAAGVDLLDEIVAAHVDLLGGGEIDRRGVVDADVDAAEHFHALAHRLRHARLVAHVDHERQCLAPRLLDLPRGAMDRARELRMRLGGLRRDRDVRPIACRPQRNREPDSAAGAGNKECLAGEAHRSRAPFTSIRLPSGSSI